MDMFICLIAALGGIGLIALAFCLEGYLEERKRRQKDRKEEQDAICEDISNLRNRYDSMKSQVSGLQAERNATNDDLTNMLDSQYIMKLSALQAGKAMIREALRNGGDRQ